MKKEETIAGKVFEYMEQHRMLERGDKVVAGISGGADSVCLLFLLCQYRKKIPFDIRVIHVDHGIRKDACEDAAYVGELCKTLEIPYYLVKADVREKARKEKISEEEAGRIVRYEAFAECAGNWGDGRVKIAVAHHMGDRAETLLFHMMRGTGLKGMSSILPVRRQESLTIIRPILCLLREETEEYLALRGIAYRTDSTNLEDKYVRNKIRHHIMEYARREICSSVDRNLCRVADLMSEAEDYIRQEMRQAQNTCVREDINAQSRRILINVDTFCALHSYLQKELILSLLESLTPEKKDIGSIHVDAVKDLFNGQTGRHVDLPYGITAEREYENVILLQGSLENTLHDQSDRTGAVLFRDGSKESCKEQEVEVLLPPENSFESVTEYVFEDLSFRFRFVNAKKLTIIPKNKYTKYFDYDKIKGRLFIRTRKQGDYLTIRGADGMVIEKKLKDYLITEKVPRTERDRIPLLVLGSQVIWLTGHRISETAKVDEGTKTILEVLVKRL